MDSQRDASFLQLVASNSTVGEVKLSSQAIPPSTPVSVGQMTLVEMDSLFSPFVRQRADEFSLEEIELLVQEVGSLRHILLSRASLRTGSKKRGWEIVANNLASKLPNAPRRTGPQLKKKWENLVLKARRKLRDGILAQEMERNECLRLVVQYLIEANTNRFQVGDQSNVLNNSLNSTIPAFENLPELPSNVEINGENNGNPAESDHDVSIKVDEPETPPATVSTITNSNHDSSDDDADDGSSDSNSTFDAQPPTSNDNPIESNSNDQSRGRKRRRIDSKDLRRSEAEYELRMKILHIKYRYWQLKYEILKNKLRQN